MKVIKVLRGFVLGGIFLIPLVVLLVTNFLFFPYVTGKAFALRLLVEIIFGAWIILALADSRYRPRRSNFLLAVSALVVGLILATIFGENPYLSFWSNFERMEGLISYLHLFAFFLVAGTMLDSEKWWRRFFTFSAGVSALVGFYGLMQLFGVFTITQGGVRIEATLGNATYLAVYMLIHIFLTLWLWSGVKRENRWLGFVYGPLLLLQTFIVYRTATRGALLGLAAGLALAALLIVWRERQNYWLRRFALASVLLLLVLAGSFLAFRNSAYVRAHPVLSRFATLSLTEATVASRLTIWQMTLRGVRERPLLGWGPENFISVFNKYYEPSLWRQEHWFDRSHNIFIDWLIQTGLLGLVAYLSLFAVSLRFIWRWQIPLATKAVWLGLLTAYAVHNFFVFDNLVSVLLFFSLLAYWHSQSVAVRSPPPPVAPPAAAGWTRLAPAAGGVILVVAFLFYYLNYRPLQAAWATNRAVASAGYVSAETTLANFREVFDWQTFGSEEAAEQLIRFAYQSQKNPQLSPQQKNQLADYTLRTAIDLSERFPQNARLKLFIGILFQATGQPDESIIYLERARALSPRKQLILLELAQSLSDNGQLAEGLAVARESFLSDENHEDSRIIYSWLLIKSEQLKEAERLWPDGLPADSRIINAYAEAGRFAEVLALWQKKVAEEPNNAQYRFNVAAAYLAVGQRMKSIAALEAAIQVDPEVKVQAEALIKEIRAGRNPLQE